MAHFLPWLAMVVIAFLIVRWLTESQTLPVNRAALRQSVVQWLASLHPETRVVEATDELLRLQVGETLCLMRLEQLARRCAEQPEQTSLLVQDAVQTFLAALPDADGLPADWERRVVVLLVPEGTADPDALACRMLLPGVEMTYAVENGASFRMIRVTELAEAGVEPETLHQFALRNLERSCSALVIEAREGEADGEELMLHFQTRDGLDAARLLVPTFFQRFSPRFDDAPLLVAIPGRDTLFVVSAENPAATGWLTWRSRQEHRRQAYPLLPAPLRVSEHGVELA
jgi:hypothetical protein